MTRSRSQSAIAQAGYAYLWVLFLIVLVGLGLSAAAEIYATSSKRDREQELLSIGRQFRAAIGQYYETQRVVGGQTERKREYPASLDDLLLDNRSATVKRHLRKVFVDPITGTPEWGFVRLGGRIVGIHSLSDSSPIKQDHFEADEMSFKAKRKYSEWVFAYPSDLLLRFEATAEPGAAGAQTEGTRPTKDGAKATGKP